MNDIVVLKTEDFFCDKSSIIFCNPSMVKKKEKIISIKVCSPAYQGCFQKPIFTIFAFEQSILTPI
jgi:hypothetical protein